MSSEKEESSTTPIFCVENCGFYGNPANNNLCSKCYRELFINKSSQLQKKDFEYCPENISHNKSTESLDNTMFELESLKLDINEHDNINQEQNVNTAEITVDSTAIDFDANPPIPKKEEKIEQVIKDRCFLCKKKSGDSRFSL